MAFPPGVLNHAEMVHRPGERELAKSVFRALGCDIWDNPYGSIVVEDHILCREVSPGQWEFEEQLERFLQDDSGANPAVAAYVQALKATPQRYPHFGFGYRTEALLDAAIDRVEKAAVSGPLAGRVEVAALFRPGDAGSVGGHIIQCFVRTDVFSVGSLALGQTIELQHYFSNDSSRRAS